MNLRTDQIKPHFERQGPQALYIVSGEEPLLMQEACDAIRASARASGYLEREVYASDAHISWPAIFEAANSLSLFGERKLIELRLDKVKFDDSAKKILSSYLERPNPDTLLLMILPKLEKAFSTTKWFQSIEQKAIVIQVWPLETKDLPRWIDTRIRQAGMQASREAIALLAERVEGNLLAAAQEIEKLRLLNGAGHLDAAAIESTVSDHARYNLFDLVDQSLEGNAETALKMLHFCRASGEEPLILLWAFVKELRALYAMLEQQQRGTPPAKLLQDFRIWNKRKPTIEKALNKQSLLRVETALSISSQIDRAAKGQAAGNAWQGLTALIMVLAGHPLTSPEIPG
ncbi:DNA polymerase III delta subunit [gamma proteobacterium HdN1]|nr:DNA polymerase III delta subunit [gamma proteobacterium HdN1]